jgi:DNA end-binding protein Ku
MSRSMWTGVITFGMVTIPVKLHTATESHSIAFHQLHEKCDTRIKEQRFCPHCEKVVAWEDIVKGYEYAKGKYIELSDEDFQKLPLPSRHTIDVVSFVDETAVDPVYFDSIYYIELGEKSGHKAFKLLQQVMESEGVIAIGKITFRSKEKLCALRTIQGKLSLQTLLYDDEIKTNEAEKSAVSVTTSEKKMAASLIGAMKGKFDPKSFKDEYQKALKS